MRKSNLWFMNSWLLIWNSDGIQHLESNEYFGGDGFLEYIQICDN